MEKIYQKTLQVEIKTLNLAIPVSFTSCGCLKHAQFLIHSANPQSRPVVIIVFAHVVSPYVRPTTFQNIAKQNKFQAKTMFTTGENVGLAEWIIEARNILFLHLEKTFPRFVAKSKAKISTFKVS